MKRIDYSKFSNYELHPSKAFLMNKHGSRIGKTNYTRLIDDDGVKRLVSLNRLIYYKTYGEIPDKCYIVEDENGQLECMTVKHHYKSTSKRHAIVESVWESCRTDLVNSLSIRNVARKNNVSVSWLYNKLRKLKLEKKSPNGNQ